MIYLGLKTAALCNGNPSIVSDVSSIEQVLCFELEDFQFKRKNG